MFPAVVEKNVDPFAVEAAANYLYDVPNVHVDFTRQEIGIDVGYWRSVSHALNCFVVESFMDELAVAQRKNSLEFRKALLQKQPRMLKVLDLVAKQSYFGFPPRGCYHGLAVMEGYGTYMAMVAEIFLEGGKVKIRRTYCALDCGQQVNPDTIVAQVESSINFGLSALMWGEINIQNGRVQQTNFDSYKMLRMDDAARIDTYVIDSNEPPGGVGEPATALVAPLSVTRFTRPPGVEFAPCHWRAGELAVSASRGERMSKNADLHKRRVAAVPRGVGNSLAVYAERAQNAELWDIEGRRYVDFASGIAVLNTGHIHPHVKAAMAAQLEKFTHGCFQVTPYESYIALAEALNKLAPGPTPKKTIFLSTGAEAVENAIKIARYATRRSAVIAFSGGFHGRTLACIALTGKVQPYKAGFGPMLPEVFHVPFPMAYHGVSSEDSLAAIDSLFKADVDPARVAAIIIEPVQGEGGFYIAPPEFLRALRALCDKHGILLIADEIQTGLRAHRKDLRHRTRRHRARSHDRGQEHRGRRAAVGGHRQGGHHGRARRRRPGRHVRGFAAGLRRGTRRARSHREGKTQPARRTAGRRSSPRGSSRCRRSSRASARCARSA